MQVHLELFFLASQPDFWHAQARKILDAATCSAPASNLIGMETLSSSLTSRTKKLGGPL
jgi:hypothetical protein